MQLSAQLTSFLKTDEQPSSLPDPRRRVRQRMRHSQFVPERRNKAANLVEPNLELAPVLAQQPCLEKLRPGKTGVAGRFNPDDWLVVVAATLTTLEPPTERAPADSKDCRSVSQRIDGLTQVEFLRAVQGPLLLPQLPNIITTTRCRWSATALLLRRSTAPKTGSPTNPHSALPDLRLADPADCGY